MAMTICVASQMLRFFCNDSVRCRTNDDCGQNLEFVARNQGVSQGEEEVREAPIQL